MKPLTSKEIINLEKLKILNSGYGCIACGKPCKYVGFIGYCAEHSTTGISYLDEKLRKKLKKLKRSEIRNKKIKL